MLGLITNAVLDVPLMLLFNKLGLNVSYGAITAALIGYTLSITTSLYTLKKKYNFNFKFTLNRLPSFVISWVIFIISILLLKLIVPTNINGRIINMFILMIYGIICFAVYVFINYKNNNLRLVFGNRLIKKIDKIFKIK